MVSCGSLRAKPEELRLTQGGVWERKLPIWPARPCPYPLTLSPLARVSHHDLYFSRLAYEVLLLIVWECTSAYFSKVIVFGCRVPQLPWFCRGIHRTPQATAFTAVVSYGERYTAKSKKGKDPRESPGQTRDELQQSSSRGATQDELHSRNIYDSNTREALSTRVVHWTQSIGVMRAGHVGTLCLGPTKPPDSLKGSVFQHKQSHYRNSLGPVNHS